jgi:uncharacterized heparinase superfamily protein
LYAHALRVARARQLRTRVSRTVSRRRFPAAAAARLAAVPGAEHLWRSAAFGHADTVVRGDGIDVLGVAVPFPPRDWSLPGEPRLRRFHLHYGDEVLGWARRGDVARARAGVAAWIAANPPAAGDAWHPYPLSRRLLNWTAALTLAPELATGELASSLSLQARYLARNVEDDVLGNHVVANACALVVAGRALGDPALAARGEAVLRREVPEQVLPDGGHYERSPAYHASVLLDLMVARAVGELDWLDDPIERMRRFAAALRRPDGLPAPFNDALLELVPDLELPDVEDGVAAFPDTGYVVVRDGGLWLAFDCGPPGPPYLPAHAHADALSFQLWLDGEPVVVDPGTFTYEPGSERDWFRSTAAHSTVLVDGRDQFELWGAFRAGPLPRVELLDGAPLCAVARYGDVEHRRTVVVTNDTVIVRDEVRGGTRLESRLPLARSRELDADAWEEGWLSERLYERARIPVAVTRRSAWMIPRRRLDPRSEP